MRETLQGLTEQQSTIVAPALKRLAEMERELAAHRRTCTDMLALIEPNMVDPAYGFDVATMTFYRNVAPIEATGPAE